MADDMAVIYRRYRPEFYWPKVIKSKHKNYSRHNADGKTTKRFSNEHEPCSKATYKKSKSSFRDCKDIISSVKQKTRKHKRKKPIGQQIPQRPQLSAKKSTRLTTDEYLKILTKKCSTPIKHDLEDDSSRGMKRTRSDTQLNTSTPYQTKFIVNTLSLDPNSLQPERQHVLNHPLMQARLRIFRCQLSTTEESCCCSCNSDAMFEVMKGLYDCYTKKNCDNCKCVLCGQLPKEVPGLPSKKMTKSKVGGLLTPLEGKTPEQKEKILRGLALSGLPFPEAKTPSIKNLIEKVKTDVGLPPTPKSAAEQEKQDKAAKLGYMFPLEGKSKSEKETILENLSRLGVELPEGRSPSEKSLIAKIKAKELALSKSQKLSQAKTGGLLSPFAGKSPEEIEKILRDLALSGTPFPEAKTPSLKKLIEKVKKDVGLPPTPKSAAEQDKQDQAAKLGYMLPLEGQSKPKKENILENLYGMGIELPEGRSRSEKSMIAKIKAKELALSKSQKLSKAKTGGLLSPFAGKSPEEIEKILRDLALSGTPFPDAKTPSLKKLIEKVKKDVGLPPTPKSAAEQDKQDQAAKLGYMLPLEGQSKPKKEKILENLYGMGIELPEGRSKSEKSMIAKIKAKELALSKSQKLTKAKTGGLLSPFAGKSPEEIEKILRDLSLSGTPFPEAKTPSLKKLIEKVKKDVGLPPTPKSAAEQDKQDQAAKLGYMLPLEGQSKPKKEKILENLYGMGIELPEGRSRSEKSMIAKIKAKELALSKSQKLTKAKTGGLLSSYAGKSPEEIEKILRDLALSGIPFPEAKTPSLKKLIEKVKKDVGLPPTPKSAAEQEKQDQAAKLGYMLPLEGQSKPKKEKNLENLFGMGIELPEGRSRSEKSLIAKIKAKELALSKSQKLSQAKTGGLLSPFAGKSPEEIEKILRDLALSGIPFPEAKTPSLKKLIEKVKKNVGLPPTPKSAAEQEKQDQAAKLGYMLPLEGQSKPKKEKNLENLFGMGIELPEGRSRSEKSLIAKIKAGPKERALSKSKKLSKAKTTEFQKELISKVAKGSKAPPPSKADSKATPSVASSASEKLRRAKAAGLLTTLDEQKEKILRGLAMTELPLPEGKTPSDIKLLGKVRNDLGIPPEPKNITEKDKYSKAQAAGLIKPLEGKTPAEKDKILRALADKSIPLPVGRTPSEKALIKKVLAETKRSPSAEKTASEKLRKATLAGLSIPLQGKTSEQKEKILRDIAMNGGLLPDGNTPSLIKLINKVRKDIGLPPTPKTDADKDKYIKAHAAGLMVPLEAKTPEQKEKILKKLAGKNIPLPEGRTSSEKSLIKKIQADVKSVSSKAKMVSEKLRKAKASGLAVSLTGMSPEQKSQILHNLANRGYPLPEGKTESEKALIDSFRKIADERTAKNITEEARKSKSAGVVTPKGSTFSAREAKAKAQGLLTPLERKSPVDRERILRSLVKARLPLPEGTTPSLKALTDKIRKDLGLPPEPQSPAMKGKHRKGYAGGIVTPMNSKTPAQKENILKTLKNAGIDLPEGRTPSEKSLIRKIKASKAGIGITTPSKLREAKTAGILTPLKEKSPEEQEKILKGLLKAGLPLPHGTTPSEKVLIKKVKDEFYVGREKASGLVDSLKEKSLEKKRKITSDLIEAGLPTSKVSTPSKKEKVKKIKADAKTAKGASKAGLPVPEGGDTRSKKRIRKSKGSLKAATAGIREEIEEIIKTDKCDAACGCDKKKIRFKHSYVKIRVTSPDISSFCPCPDECIPGVVSGVFTDNEGIKVTVGSVGVPCNKYRVYPQIKNRNLQKMKRSISSFCSNVLCSKKCIPGGCDVLTDSRGIKFTVGTVNIPSYTVHSQIIQENSHENKRSLQSFKESFSPLKIALIGSDCATDDLNSSKSTVIFNSGSDVSISDKERLLPLIMNNDNFKKEFKFKTSAEKKPFSYIYHSCFSDSSGDFRSSLQITPNTLHLPTSSLRSLYTNTIYKTESSLSHTADVATSMTNYNLCDSDRLSKVSYPENHLKYSSQSIDTPRSTERVDSTGSTSTNTLSRKSQSYVTYSKRKIDISNYLAEFSSQLVAKGDTSCASLRSRNPLRGIKRNMLELMQKVLSNRSLSSSSVFMVISSSGHGDASPYLHATDTLSNLSHSEPSSLPLKNNQPQISLLALNMFICAKFISKAKAQKDLWKRKKAKAVLRLRNMGQQLLLQMQNVQVYASNKNTSSTVASQELKHVEHTVKKTSVLCRKWMANRGNRVTYQTRHIDTRIHSFSSPSSYFPSTSTVVTTPLYNPQFYVNSQVTTNNPSSTVDETLSCIKIYNGSVKTLKTCTFAKRVGEMDCNSQSCSVHRMKTCY